jgi:hypothetical protein
VGPDAPLVAGTVGGLAHFDELRCGGSGSR